MECWFKNFLLTNNKDRGKHMNGKCTAQWVFTCETRMTRPRAKPRNRTSLASWKLPCLSFCSLSAPAKVITILTSNTTHHIAMDFNSLQLTGTQRIVEVAELTVNEQVSYLKIQEYKNFINEMHCKKTHLRGKDDGFTSNKLQFIKGHYESVRQTIAWGLIPAVQIPKGLRSRPCKFSHRSAGKMRVTE